ncbi:MAG: helix-turn-helix domain-containing protein [Roseburia sp.]|nr:helix-turn-helix domain-containing protein [Roseburia sp.]
MLKVEVGKRLKMQRKRLNLTQQQVAKMLGIAQPVYQRFEKGIYELDYEKLIFLCKLFNVSSDYLLGISEY